MAEESIPSGLLAALNLAVLEFAGEDFFRLLATEPEWFRSLVPESASPTFQLGERMPFLENFLVDARSFWEEPGLDSLVSGPWVEVTAEGEVYLEATALVIEGRAVLLVRNLGSKYRERVSLLQKARENSLAHQLLNREIQKKEILLHCIVHDLAGPLTGIKSLFTLLGREELSEAGQRRLDIGNQASTKLESMIRQILEVFSAELQTLESCSSDPAKAPDLAECLGSVIDTLVPAATLKQIRLSIEPSIEDCAGCRILGERGRLERVLFNLVDNALRHTPDNGQVTVAVDQEGTDVLVRVQDTGPGVPEEDVPRLFGRFFQGGKSRGKVGLGLYFCRIVVERWGGAIGYEPGPAGGSVFWFRLKRLEYPVSPVP